MNEGGSKIHIDDNVLCKNILYFTTDWVSLFDIRCYLSSVHIYYDKIFSKLIMS